MSPAAERGFLGARRAFERPHLDRDEADRTMFSDAISVRRLTEVSFSGSFPESSNLAPRRLPRRATLNDPGRCRAGDSRCRAVARVVAQRIEQLAGLALAIAGVRAARERRKRGLRLRTTPQPNQ